MPAVIKSICNWNHLHCSLVDIVVIVHVQFLWKSANAFIYLCGQYIVNGYLIRWFDFRIPVRQSRCFECEVIWWPNVQPTELIAIYDWEAEHIIPCNWKRTRNVRIVCHLVVDRCTKCRNSGVLLDIRFVRIFCRRESVSPFYSK